MGNPKIVENLRTKTSSSASPLSLQRRISTGNHSKPMITSSWCGKDVLFPDSWFHFLHLLPSLRASLENFWKKNQTSSFFLNTIELVLDQFPLINQFAERRLGEYKWRRLAALNFYSCLTVFFSFGWVPCAFWLHLANAFLTKQKRISLTFSVR